MSSCTTTTGRVILPKYISRLIINIEMLNSAYKISHIEFISILIHFLNAPGSGTIMCPALENPPNGNLVLSGNTVGETADYTCNTGFILVGDSTLTCGGDGQWSGSPPVCNRKYLSKNQASTWEGEGGEH